MISPLLTDTLRIVIYVYLQYPFLSILTTKAGGLVNPALEKSIPNDYSDVVIVLFNDCDMLFILLFTKLTKRSNLWSYQYIITILCVGGK